MKDEITPLLSVIVPNYNNSKYLSQCLDSIRNQTYRNIEIIVIDDCSTDNSIEIIEDYRKKDPRIKLISNTINQKVSKTRDIGIKQSTSKWITTLDSDDYYYCNNKIEKELDILKINNFNKNLIVFSGIIHVDKNRNELSKIMNKEKTKIGHIFEEILTRNCAIPRDFIFSKEVYSQVNGYDFNIPLYEDWDLKIRLSKVAKFLFSNIDGIAYRRHEEGLSSANQKDHRKWVEYIFEKNTLNLKDKIFLKVKLKENFNFNDELNNDLKKTIISSLEKSVLNSNIDNFSIWGIGEVTNILVKKLKKHNILINNFIDSRAKNEKIECDNMRVITLEKAINNGEKNFILVSWNKRELLKSILLKEIEEKGLQNITIILPEIKEKRT